MDNEEIQEPVIYCGPDVPKLGVKKYAVYSGEMSSAMKYAMKEIPEIGKLIVKSSELEETRGLISVKGTAEYEYYKRIENAKY